MVKRRIVFFYWCSNLGLGFQLEHLSVYIASNFEAQGLRELCLKADLYLTENPASLHYKNQLVNHFCREIVAFYYECHSDHVCAKFVCRQNTF